MNIRRIAAILVLGIVLGCGAGFWSARAECIPVQSVGRNYQCLYGSSCSLYGFFCSYEQCRGYIGCIPEPPGQTIECYFLGCLNGLQGNCQACS